MGLQNGWVGGWVGGLYNMHFSLFYFVRMNNKAIKFAYPGGCSILRPKNNSLLDLYNSSHHTQPYTIIT